MINTRMELVKTLIEFLNTYFQTGKDFTRFAGLTL